MQWRDTVIYHIHIKFCDRLFSCSKCELFRHKWLFPVCAMHKSCYHDLPFAQWCLSPLLYFVTGKFLLNAGPNGSKKSGLHTWRMSPATRVSGLTSLFYAIENVEDCHCSVYGNSSAPITQWLFLEHLFFFLCPIWSLNIEIYKITILSVFEWERKLFPLFINCKVVCFLLMFLLNP
jgi:hypothetical protein